MGILWEGRGVRRIGFLGVRVGELRRGLVIGT